MKETQWKGYESFYSELTWTNGRELKNLRKDLAITIFYTGSDQMPIIMSRNGKSLPDIDYLYDLFPRF